MKKLANKTGILLGAALALILAVLLVCGLTSKTEAPVFAQTCVTAYAAEEEGATDGAAAAVEETQPADATGDKAMAAGIAIGLAAAAGAIGMGIAIAKTSESIARQPEAEGKIRSTLMLGLVFIETAIIYALIVAILVIFVL